MDRELSASTRQAQKRKRIWQIGIAAALIAVAIFGFRSLITPSINFSEISTAPVEEGPWWPPLPLRVPWCLSMSR
ncbi:hypothetical protein [Pontibacter sp. BAB1700]|uniref:hypothetical protein n=1 Tax=Pontibacter sp. BAB1700 TaxID=1144253 RepID=UPI0012DE7236|nr:hypothetical protein [Pontibacter sp. BAB1700]